MKGTRKWIGLAAIAICFGLIMFAACGRGDDPVTTDAVVTSLDLTGIIPAPVKNQPPVTEFTAGTQYTLAITWANADGVALTGNFAPSTEYIATAVITVRSGWTLQGLAPDAFTHAGARTAGVTFNAADRTITIEFPATTAADEDDVVTNLDLTTRIPAPATGAAPVFTYDGVQYSLAITWANDSGAPLTAGNTFSAYTKYIATAEITVKTGWTLEGLAATAFTHTNADVAFSGTTITLDFEATAGIPDPVTDFNLTGKFAAPANRRRPQFSFTSAQYNANILWAYTADAIDQIFETGEIIVATVTLTANPGYTFEGVGANAFSFTGAQSITNSAGTGMTMVVTVTFNALPDPVLVSRWIQTGAGDFEFFFYDDGSYEMRNNVGAKADEAEEGIFTVTPEGADHNAPGTVFNMTVTRINDLEAATGANHGTDNAQGQFNNAAALQVPFGTVGHTATVQANGNLVNVAWFATGTNPTGGDTRTYLPASGVVSALDLTTRIPLPVTGAAPVTSYTGSQYSLNINWSPAVVGHFASDTAYTATAQIALVQGWRLDGLASNAFTHSGATSVTLSGTTITLVFPATTVDEVVTNLDLTNVIPRPLLGGTPVLTYTGTQYSLNISWNHGTAPFTAGTVYTATANVTLVPGFVLTGLTANSFTHPNATSVTLNVATSTITVVFEVTPAALIMVNDLNLTGKFAAPANRRRPQAEFTSVQYNGTIAWSYIADPIDQIFETGEDIRAVITLTVASGLTFDGVGANAFSYTGAQSVTNAAGSGNTITVTVIFNELPEPTLVSRWQHADMDFFFWNDGSYEMLNRVAQKADDAEEGIFTVTNDDHTVGGTVFTMIVTRINDLEAATGMNQTNPLNIAAAERVADGYDDVRHSSTVAADGNSFVRTAWFFAGAAPNFTQDVRTFNRVYPDVGAPGNGGNVTERNLTALFDMPALLRPTARDPIDTAQFTGTVAWYYAGTPGNQVANFPVTTPTFESNENIIRAVVTLTARQGFYFEPGGFTYNPAGVAWNNPFDTPPTHTISSDGTTATVTVTFAPLGKWFNTWGLTASNTMIVLRDNGTFVWNDIGEVSGLPGITGTRQSGTFTMLLNDTTGEIDYVLTRTDDGSNTTTEFRLINAGGNAGRLQTITGGVTPGWFNRIRMSEFPAGHGL